MYVVTLSFFLFNDTSTPEIYTYGHTLSLHDALPISAHHVGYHLISAGRPALEQALGFRLGRRRRLLRFMLQRPTAVYFALLALLLVPPLLAIGCWLTQQMVPVALSVTICALLIVPLLGLAVPLLHGLVTWRLPPRPLAKPD